jgi:hypothetical protein
VNRRNICLCADTFRVAIAILYFASLSVLYILSIHMNCLKRRTSHLCCVYFCMLMMYDDDDDYANMRAYSRHHHHRLM